MIPSLDFIFMACYVFDMSGSHEQYDVGVKALIVHKKRLLMVRRADHGVWEVPGGRVNYNEDLLATLKREVREELPGAKVTRIDHILHAEQSAFRLPYGNRLLLLFFPVKVSLSRLEQTISSEHVDIRWVDLTELNELDLHTTVKQAAILALDR